MPIRFRGAFRFRKFSRYSRGRMLRSLRSRRTYNGRRRFRRMMRRSRGKPELKFIQQEYNPQTSPNPASTLVANSKWIGALTPSTINVGSSVSARIGNEIKFMRNQFRLDLVTLGTGSAAGINGYVRILVVSPRIAYTQFENHINLMVYNEPMDYNVATVHHDRYYVMGYDSWVPAGADRVPTPVPTVRHTKFVTSFPRKVKFAQGSSTVDVNTDTLYAVIFNNTAYNIRTLGFIKTTFIDT